MIKMYVNVKIEGRWCVEVEAENVHEAIEKANDHFTDADFGELSEIESEAISVEDEAGNFLFEK